MGLRRKKTTWLYVAKLSVAILLPLICLLIPLDWYPVEGLTLVERRVVAIFVLTALFWILEPIPIYATSIVIIALELLLVSDAGLLPFRSGDPAALGPLLSYREIMATFASPIIILFLGGFFLAMAATKYRLDLNLARVLLRPFGTRPDRVTLGLMIITAVFSMFMSNTATTAMMLSILMPILQVLEPGDRGRTALAMSIPVAANIGGIGTPIGTPPNAIALKYLTGDFAVSFGEWMGFGVPFVVVLLLVSWLFLRRLFPFKNDRLELRIQGSFVRTPQAYIVYATFLVTVLLWLTDFIHGMNSYVVAIIPVAVFLTTQIITKEDLKTISWDVLWLVVGGIALGVGLEKSGLALHLVQGIPFQELSPYLIIILATVLPLLMANFMSHTATANLLLPIIAALGTSLPNLQEVGGGMALILGLTFASSLGMSLPISTPPNALAHSTGEITTAQMARVGAFTGTIGLLLIYVMLFLLQQTGFF